MLATLSTVLELFTGFYVNGLYEMNRLTAQGCRGCAVFPPQVHLALLSLLQCCSHAVQRVFLTPVQVGQGSIHALVAATCSGCKCFDGFLLLLVAITTAGCKLKPDSTHSSLASPEDHRHTCNQSCSVLWEQLYRAPQHSYVVHSSNITVQWVASVALYTATFTARYGMAFL